jgi:hypothetical protein
MCICIQGKPYICRTKIYSDILVVLKAVGIVAAGFVAVESGVVFVDPIGEAVALKLTASDVSDYVMDIFLFNPKIFGNLSS